MIAVRPLVEVMGSSSPCVVPGVVAGENTSSVVVLLEEAAAGSYISYVIKKKETIMMTYRFSYIRKPCYDLTVVSVLVRIKKVVHVLLVSDEAVKSDQRKCESAVDRK